MSAVDEHREANDALGAFVLGALPADEHGRVERHLETCETCRADADELQTATVALAESVPERDPPPHLRQRLMAIVDSEAQLLRAAGSEADEPPAAKRERRGGISLRRVPVLAGAAATLALGVVAGLLIAGGGGGSSTRTVEARVTDPRAGGDASAHVTVNGDSATLVVNRMPAPPRGRVYEVWVRRAGRAPQPGGAMFVLRSGSVHIPRAVHGDDAVLVTPEPPGGSQTPTRPPVVVTHAL